MQQAGQDQMKKMAEGNSKAGKEFLEANAKKDGVKVTASGLQYQVITEGTGVKPTAEDRVKVHYTGTLLDGTKFDSSVDRGEPAEFGVSQVIPGWTEGLQIMPAGSKYIFWIPSGLAYGERGAGQIPPYSTLVFDLELVSIVKPEVKEAQPATEVSDKTAAAKKVVSAKKLTPAKKAVAKRRK